MPGVTGRIYRPVVNTDICDKCAVCYRGCPAEIVPGHRLENKSKRGLVYKEYWGKITKLGEDKYYPNVDKVFNMTPCQAACPIHQDIRSYVRLAAEKRFTEAIDVIRETNPLPWVTSYVCHHPCEKACIRKYIDEQVSIRNIKRLLISLGKSSEGNIQKATKVAVIGSGPAGLSSAYFLAKRAYKVEIFEKDSSPGGMLRWGIPKFRLPHKILQKDLEYIQDMGVNIKTRIEFGRDTSLSELKEEGFGAFILATGTQKGTTLSFSDAKNINSIDCLRFLKQFAANEHINLGHNVVVVGGGNAAIDSARVAKRCGAKKVTIIYRRGPNEMSADKDEVSEAKQEGVEIDFLTVPLDVVFEDGKSKLKCGRTKLGKPDESGRKSPVLVQDSEYFLEVDFLITAIGQKPDLSWNENQIPFAFSRDDTFLVNGDFMTNIPCVFAAGDAITGPTSIVEAMASGRAAALSVIKYLA